MNFAYDAIWWKLKQPNVRDLASLLVSPMLWNTGKELPIKYLLGDNGFRYLLYLDENPQNLLTFIKNSNFKKKLNQYAKILLYFWFINAPHCNLIDKNIIIHNDNDAVDKIDFIVQINDNIYYIEFTCKYYVNVNGIENKMHSINNKDDMLINKISKLNTKLALIRNKYFKKYLLKKKIINIQPASIVRGMVFFKKNNRSSWKYLNPYLWNGNYGLENIPENSRLTIVPKLNYLSPIIFTENKLYCKYELNDKINKIIALIEKRTDGTFHEKERFFIHNK